jgi:hypothetical protein
LFRGEATNENFTRNFIVRRVDRYGKCRNSGRQTLLGDDVWIVLTILKVVGMALGGAWRVLK